MLIDKLRSARSIDGKFEKGLSANVAFLGLYNAEPHFDRLRSWIPNLQRVEGEQPCIILVDNASTDSTPDFVSEMTARLRELQWNVVTATNPINLGGWGSLQLNLDLLSDFSWVTTFHQDDIYELSHLREHIELCRSAATDLGLIASEANSVDLQGRKLGYPRGAWFAGANMTSAEIFLALIRSHYLPFSGGTFRMSFLEQADIPWTSTAFPDTEMLLRGLPGWKYMYTEQPKVTYLENPHSESHSLGVQERRHGATLALLRVFGGQGFAELVSKLESEEFVAFCEKLHGALEVRLGNSELTRMVYAFALDVAVTSRIGSMEVYSHFEVLSKGYAEVEDWFAANLSSELGHFETGRAIESRVEMGRRHSSSKRVSMKARILLIAGLLPEKLVKRFWVSIMRLRIFRKIWRQWDY